jgi:hypothetical protein
LTTETLESSKNSCIILDKTNECRESGNTTKNPNYK